MKFFQRYKLLLGKNAVLLLGSKQSQNVLNVYNRLLTAFYAGCSSFALGRGDRLPNKTKRFNKKYISTTVFKNQGQNRPLISAAIWEKFRLGKC